MGTKLPAGINHILTVSFSPSDTTDYTGAPATATISVLPTPPLPSRIYATNTIVTATPRASTFGQRITLTATVKNRSRTGGMPTGSVNFLDAFSNILGVQVRLTHGKAVLKPRA